jgi:hypothetical protein
MSTRQKSTRPTEIGTLIGVRLQKELLSLLDQWRKKQSDLPNRQTAIRQLIELGTKGKK